MPNVVMCPSMGYVASPTPAPDFSGIVAGFAASPYLRAFRWGSSTNVTDTFSPSSAPASQVFGVAVHPTKEWVACVTATHLYVYRFTYEGGFGTQESAIDHTGAVLNDICFSPDGLALFICGTSLSGDVIAYHFDPDGSGLGSAYSGSTFVTTDVSKISFVPDGSALLYCSDAVINEAGLKSWNTSSGWGSDISVGTFNTSGGAVHNVSSSLKISGENYLIVTHSKGFNMSKLSGGTVAAWYFKNLDDKYADDVAFKENSTQMIVAARQGSGRIELYGINSSSPYCTYLNQAGVAGEGRCVRYTSDENAVFVGCSASPWLQVFEVTSSNTLIPLSFSGTTGGTVWALDLF